MLWPIFWMSNLCLTCSTLVRASRDSRHFFLMAGGVCLFSCRLPPFGRHARVGRGDGVRDGQGDWLSTPLTVLTLDCHPAWLVFWEKRGRLFPRKRKALHCRRCSWDIIWLKYNSSNCLTVEKKNVLLIGRVGHQNGLIPRLQGELCTSCGTNSDTRCVKLIRLCSQIQRSVET